MPDDISATGWLVILSALALGFGLVRFLIVSAGDRTLHGGVEPGQDESRDEVARVTRPWHEVLEVLADAPMEQILAAYRSKSTLYEPDRVASLGPEFEAIAEQRRREIIAAYEAARIART